MDRSVTYTVILGMAICISLAIGGYELAGFTQDFLIPREHVCIPRDIPSGGLSGYWHAAAGTTGIDPGTARLVRMYAELGDGGTIKKIELEYLAENNGTERYYVMWYLNDTDRCGWSDGISYPKKDMGSLEPLQVGPECALQAIGMVPVTHHAGTPDTLILETHRFPGPAHETRDSSTGEIRFFRNGTPATLPLSVHGPEDMLPFSLSVTRKTPPDHR